MRSLCFLAAWCLVLMGCAVVMPGIPDVPIVNYQQVEPGFFRGAQPDAAGLKYLYSIGIKTIIDINNSESAEAPEASLARVYGIDFVYIPLSGFWAPSDGDTSKIQSILADKSKRPIYIHCKHGEDRTGLMVGIYRVEVEHWVPVMAHDEMLIHGFHTILLPLNHYYWRRESK